MFTVKRSIHNPILSPDKNHPWEAAAAFNASPAKVGKQKVLVYRAMSEPEKLKEPHIRMSVVASSFSKDGIHFGDNKVLIAPEEHYDQYGCEDPRVTKFGKDYYIFYTGLGGFPFSAENIKVCVAKSKDLKTITERHLVTPFNSKAMALFPEKIKGKMVALLTVNSDTPPSEICLVEFEKESDMWNGDFWREWRASLDRHKLSVRRLAEDHLELGAVPVKTSKGWLVVYCHIQRYGQGDQVFGTEILLLDLKNPRNILGRTKGPIMVSDDYYENAGLTSHVLFPSGAEIDGEDFVIHYGAADTHCAIASINLKNLLKSLDPNAKKIISRYQGNPILIPRPNTPWEEGGVLNPAAIFIDGKTHILYRGTTTKNVSTIGYASSKDGFSIDERLPEPIYNPRENFEKKYGSDENFGCEDPRLMKIGDTIYMAYTGYDGSTPRVAVTTISEIDFLAKKWNWSKPYAITPEGVPNKDAVLIPEPIEGLPAGQTGKYIIMHRVSDSICAYVLNSLDFSKEKVDQCIEIISPRRGMWDGAKVGVAAPPVKTKRGWLLFYHGVSRSTTYRVGALLLSLKDPTIVLARSAVPLFEPEEEYERKGLKNNVVFPCGLVERGKELYIYYGGGDSVVAVASMKTEDILKTLL